MRIRMQLKMKMATFCQFPTVCNIYVKLRESIQNIKKD